MVDMDKSEWNYELMNIPHIKFVAHICNTEFGCNICDKISKRRYLLALTLIKHIKKYLGLRECTVAARSHGKKKHHFII